MLLLALSRSDARADLREVLEALRGPVTGQITQLSNPRNRSIGLDVDGVDQQLLERFVTALQGQLERGPNALPVSVSRDGGHIEPTNRQPVPDQTIEL